MVQVPEDSDAPGSTRRHARPRRFRAPPPNGENVLDRLPYGSPPPPPTSRAAEPQAAFPEGSSPAPASSHDHAENVADLYRRPSFLAARWCHIATHEKLTVQVRPDSDQACQLSRHKTLVDPWPLIVMQPRRRDDSRPCSARLTDQRTARRCLICPCADGSVVHGQRTAPEMVQRVRTGGSRLDP